MITSSTNLLIAMAPISSIFGVELCLSGATNALAATKVNCTVPSVSYLKNIHVPNPQSPASENACNCGLPFAVAGYRHRSNSTSVSLFIACLQSEILKVGGKITVC